MYLIKFDFKLHYYSGRSIYKSNILFWRSNHVTNFYNKKNIMLIKPKFLIIQILEGLVVENEEKTLLTDICYGNQLSKQEELVAKAMQKL